MRLTNHGNNGPYPQKKGACSGYLVTSDSGKNNLLMDCGTGVLARLQDQIHLDDLNAIALSHLHYDHMSDMLPLHYALQFNPRKHPLDVFAPEEPAQVRRLLAGNDIDLWPMQDRQINEMKISFCPVRHPVETYAIAVECDGARLVYTGYSNTDTSLALI